ncbi:MAG: hypothetical protein F6K40_29850 [Okeania sp. SIO3I5]|uniref:hypothetical protein n=1 Tax=Okeania sp. SIO3I5 TaxID=2607805 RepID=UPI0013B68126|nr:hypothetical protein [Okeania sp. SIO3I5]NEQ40222.1 hypothetical protein [Okeania sp. SIO3I5]
MLKKITTLVSLTAISLSIVSISAIAQDTSLKVGIVQELVTGDLMCYATLIDENGKEHYAGASFEICADQDYYLNKKVQLTYQEVNINDCQSSEPCGKTRKEWIISKMKIIE